MNTGLYIRVSTEEQAREGYSISAQKTKLMKYCELNDWFIKGIYIDDGISGKNIKKRPQMKKLINDIKAKKLDNVLVYKIDRLTRSTKDLLYLMDLFGEHGCNFNSFTEQIDTSTATGRMFLKMLGIFAELEREMIAERVSFGLEQKARQGKYVGQTKVYGYDLVDGTLKVNENEAINLKEMYDMYLKGNSFGNIAKTFNVRGVKGKCGGNWYRSTIKDMLLNELYIGKITYGKRTKKEKQFTVEGQHEPIVSEELFNKVKTIIEGRAISTVTKFTRDDVIFGTTIYCGKCKKRNSIKVYYAKYKDKRYKTNEYLCRQKRIGLCDQSHISEKKIEKAFLQYIKQLKLDTDIDMNNNTDQQKVEKQIKLIQSEISKSKQRLKKIQYLYIDEKIDEEGYLEITNELQDSIEANNKKIQDLKDSSDNKYYTQEDIEQLNEIIKTINTTWPLLNNKEKHAFINQFIKAIYVHKNENKDIIISDVQWY